MNSTGFNPYHFLRHWVANAVSIWFVAAVAIIVSWVPFAILISVFGQYTGFGILIRVLTTLAILMIPGMAIGYVLGDTQYSLVKDILNWNLSQWVRASAIGGLAGGVLVILMMALLGSQVTERLQWMIALPLFMFPVSVGQWWCLRQSAADAWMWILANVVGGIVFSGIFFSTQPLPFFSHNPLGSLLAWLFGAVAFGVITGVVMLWLYDRPLSVNDQDGEYAPVYLEVRNRDER